MESVGGDNWSVGGDMDSFGGDNWSVGGDMDSFGGDKWSVGGDMDSIGGDNWSIGGDMDSVGGDIKKTPVHIDFVRELFLFYNSKNVIVSQSHFLFPNLQIQYRNINI